MVQLRRVPSYCTHLNGLLTLFQQQITKGCNICMEPIMVSARFSYVLKDWNSSVWTQEPPDFDFMRGETLGTVELGKLPFGAAFDPIEELHLFATWPHMPANVVVDSENYTDLDPRQAPEWSIQVKMMSSTSCLLEEYLTDFIHLCSNQNSLLQLLGDLDIYAKNDCENFDSVFNVLTEPKVSTAVVRTALKKTTADVGPISDDIMLPILYFLFPDAEDEPIVHAGNPRESLPHALISKMSSQAPRAPSPIDSELDYELNNINLNEEFLRLNVRHAANMDEMNPIQPVRPRPMDIVGGNHEPAAEQPGDAVEAENMRAGDAPEAQDASDDPVADEAEGAQQAGEAETERRHQRAGRKWRARQHQQRNLVNLLHNMANPYRGGGKGKRGRGANQNRHQ